MDPSRYATTTFKAKINGEATLADLLLSDVRAEECIQHTEMGDIIASDDLLLYDDKVNELIQNKKKYGILKEKCAMIEHMYDYIIIDTPPTNSIFLGNALSYADKVIIPTTPDVYGIAGLMDVPKLIEYYRKYNPYMSIIGVLIVKYRKYKYSEGSILEIEKFVKENLETTVFKTRVRESVRCAEALGYGLPLQKYAPKCNTAIDYMNFTKEFLVRERQ